MKRIDLGAVPVHKGSSYPPPFDEPCRERRRAALGESARLTQFGVNLLSLAPGSWSSQRHWHSGEDEFVWVLEGEVVLVTDQGDELLHAGDCVGFPAGEANGHHLQNRSARTALLLVVGTRSPQDVAHYPDVDLRWSARGGATHKDGTPY